MNATRPASLLYAPLWVGALAAAMLGTARPARADAETDLRRTRVVEIVERAKRAVVFIRTNQIVQRVFYPFFDLPPSVGERDGGLGSGAIFHPDGYVITNAHVIARASKIFVGLSGESGETFERQAIPLAVDIPNDLAILRIQPAAEDAGKSWPHLALGRSHDLLLGEGVVAMGHPFRLGLTVTQGIVSGLERTLRIDQHEFHDFLQVDAAINPGNSGGPLFDMNGRWIGVNTAIYNRSAGAEGIGFAIPADRVRALVARAFKRRLVRPDWLGIELDAAEDGEARVAIVFPSGPAREAGLLAGDKLVAIDGKRVPTLFDAQSELLIPSEGARVRLTVERKRAATRGEGPFAIQEIVVPLAPLPTAALAMQRLGFSATETDAFDGVEVASVKPGGPSDKIGLRRGDIVVGLGGYRIQNTDDLLVFLQYVSPGDLVTVQVSAAARERDWRRTVVSGSLQGRLVAE